MNIFFLDSYPSLAAADHCDRHVVKMILETAQLLSAAHWVLGEDKYNNLYKLTHRNHPMCVWVRASIHNYMWTKILLKELLNQYTLRYNKIHKTEERGIHLLNPPLDIPQEGFIPPPLCMPTRYMADNYVNSYRNYYKYKSTVMKMRWYGKERPPIWWSMY